MAGIGMPNPELECLREEVNKLRKEIVDARIERAAKHLELMRNWLGIYTPIVSLAFLIFALLGFRGLSDIQNNREKVETTSKQAASLLRDVSTSFESLTKKNEDFDRLVEDNKQIVEHNKTVLMGFRSSLNELERKHGELRTTEVQIQNNLRDLSSEVKTTSNSVSSSVNLTRGIGSLVSNSLNVPVITSVFSDLAGRLTIGGFGFGSSPGQVFLNPNVGILTADLQDTGGSGEVPRAIITWADDVIVCRETQTQKMPFPTSPGFLLQVISSSGAKSNVYSAPPAPSAPSFLTVTPQ
jgi:hypothetical protein